MSRTARGALSFRNQRAMEAGILPSPAPRPPGGVPRVTRGAPSGRGVTQAGTPKSSESDRSVTLSRTGPEARTAPRERRTASSAVRAARSTSCVEKTHATPRVGAAPEDVEDEEPVARVEARRRLVEEEDARLARQDAGEVDPLPLAAGEAPHVPLLEARRVDLLERRPGDVDVGRGRASRRARGTGVRPRRTTSSAVAGKNGSKPWGRYAEDAGPPPGAGPGRAACPRGGASPREGTRRPARTFRRVDFPEPFSPRSATSRPAPNASVTSRRTSRPRA